MDTVILCPERLRQLPKQFSWLDQQLARQRYFEHADPDSWLLYLFLVTVADAQGLSFYAERSLCQRLRLSPARLGAARERLIALALIAYRQPLYQVLQLPTYPGCSAPHRPRPAQLEKHLATLRHALTARGERQ